MTEDHQTARRGRPPKPAAERRRHNQTVRVREATRQRLEEQAAKFQRSISEEIEWIVELHLMRQDHNGGEDAEKLLGFMRSSFDLAAQMGRPVSFTSPDSILMAKGVIDTCFRHLSEGPKPFDVPERPLTAEEQGDNLAQLTLRQAGEIPGPAHKKD